MNRLINSRGLATAVAAMLLSGYVLAQAPVQTAPASKAAAASPAVQDIRDIRGPRYVSSPWMLPLLGGAAALIAVGAYAAWRRRRPRAALLPSEVALQRLAAARTLMEPGNGRAFSIEVSDTVRFYIETQFGVRAAHFTMEEFFRDLLTSSPAGLAAHQRLLDAFLAQCDLAKFAAWNLSLEDMEDMFQKALGFVIDTKKPSPAAAAAAQPTVPRNEYVQLSST
ncbi:MAG: hypothetical protein ABI356_00565 [Steroidobacteraceae bacterium]